MQQAVHLGSPLRNFIRGFILYRRGLRYIRKSSCFFSAIKSTIGATVGCIGYHSVYLPPLTKLASQTEFSQLEKDCSGSSKDGHGLKFER